MCEVACEESHDTRNREDGVGEQFGELLAFEVLMPSIVSLLAVGTETGGIAYDLAFPDSAGLLQKLVHDERVSVTFQRPTSALEGSWGWWSLMFLACSRSVHLPGYLDEAPYLHA